jgi:hypothetical protein
VWLSVAIVFHVVALAIGISFEQQIPATIVGSIAFLLVLVGGVRWLDSRRMARKVLAVREAESPADVAIFQGVLRSRDPMLRVEVGGRLLKVRAPETTLARRDARPLTPLERVSVLGWASQITSEGGLHATTIELERALIHPGDVESLRQRILQHGDFYAMRWVAASFSTLCVALGLGFFL